MASAKGSGRGPLAGVRVLDLSGLGPAPFATMMLADFGASILSVRRPDPLPFDPAIAMSRGKDVIGLDLRSPGGQEVARRLAKNVDVLVEVGPARRTAAAHDAATRAQRQQEAEREIGADPFVQSLIREFGASIVPGSIRPITPDAGSNGAPSVH